MRKYLTLNYIGSTASVVALLFFIYFQFIKKHDKILTVRTYETTLLTQNNSNENGLTSKYYINDSLVDNLWVISFSITNTGDKPIIGKGERKDIIGEDVCLKLTNGYKIIKVDSINSNFPFQINLYRNNLHCSFKQIKPKEFFEYKLYLINQLTEETAPSMLLDDRDLIEVETNIVNRYDIDNQKNLMNRFSKKTQTVFKYIALLFLLIITIVLQNGLMNYTLDRYSNWVARIAVFVMAIMILTIMLQFRL